MDGTLAWSQVAAPSAFYDDTLRGIAVAAGGFVAVGNTFVADGPGAEGWLLRVTGKGALGCACVRTTCHDGNAWTTDACYLGLCRSTKVATGGVCSVDGKAGACNSGGTCVPSCGNGVCNSGESTVNCPADCKAGSHPCDSYYGLKHPSFGCFCDSVCKSSGDCCSSNGGKATSCFGSTCASCK